jgi:pimeloyl-ACP methyl ester carboxylesterase
MKKLIPPSAVALLVLTLAPTLAGQLARRGIFGAMLGPSSASASRIEVGTVRPGSLASSMGLQSGDVVLSVNQQRLDSAGSVQRYVRALRAGTRVMVKFQRGEKKMSASGVMPEYPRETYDRAAVIYDSVLDAKGQRLRTIVTHPKNSSDKLPAIFVAGWLSCDSVESPRSNTDAMSKVFRGLAEMDGFATVRLDKQGVGDSEGVCGDTDFETELSGYRAAFNQLGQYSFIDPQRIFVFGVSNGGGFAPLVAVSEKVHGYVIEGGWVKTWFEHMMEIERRRFRLSGNTPEQVNEAMKGVAELYTEYLIKGRIPGDIVNAQPALAKFWTEPPDHQYERPAAFYQQLQKLNLAREWSKVKTSVLALHGEYDWIMSRDDHELIAQIVNSNAPGKAEFHEIPGMGHGFQRFANWDKAFAWEEEDFDPQALNLMKEWFRQHAEN